MWFEIDLIIILWEKKKLYPSIFQSNSSRFLLFYFYFFYNNNWRDIHRNIWIIGKNLIFIIKNYINSKKKKNANYKTKYAYSWLSSYFKGNKVQDDLYSYGYNVKVWIPLIFI